MIRNYPWSKRKKLAAYGAGNALLGLRAVHDLAIDYVIDDTPGYSGQKVDGLDIYPSSHLKDQNRAELFVLICANTSAGVFGIARRLLEMGYMPGVDFTDCSCLQSESMSSRLLEAFQLKTSSFKLNAVRGLSLGLRPRNLSTIAGTWLFLELLESLPRSVVGSVAECGLYQGANALIASALSSRLAERPYALYDSFEGLSELSCSDPEARRGEFADVSMPEVEMLFSGFTNVRIVKGRFENTMPKEVMRPHGLVYIDCDLRDPTLFCCRHFWPLLAPGGYLMTHDYWFPEVSLPKGAKLPFIGVKEAFDIFCDEQEVNPVVFPETSHAVVRKP